MCGFPGLEEVPRRGQGTGFLRQRLRKSDAAEEGRIRMFAWMWPFARPEVWVVRVPARQRRRTS